jgi:hypothetical protein
MEIDFSICENGTSSGTSGSVCGTNCILEQLIGRNNCYNSVSNVNITNENSVLLSFRSFDSPRT